MDSAPAQKNIGPSIEQSLSFGWQQFKANYKVLLVYVLILFLLNVVSGIFSEYDISMALELVISLVSLYFGIGLTRIGLALYENKAVSYKYFFDTPFQLFIRVLLVVILSVFAIGAGLLLLIIPGIYLIFRLSMVQYIAIEKNLEFFEIFKQSGIVTHGRKLKILLFWIVIGFINLVGALALMLGLIVTIPVSALAAVHFYKSLAANLVPQKGAVATPNSAPETLGTTDNK